MTECFALLILIFGVTQGLASGTVFVALLGMLPLTIHYLLVSARRKHLVGLVQAIRFRTDLEQDCSSRLASAIGILKNGSSAKSAANLNDQRFLLFRCETMLIARVEIVAGRQEILLDGRGSKGRQFEGRLREFVAPFLLKGELLPFGLRDETLSQSLVGNFSKFGFAFSVCLPITGIYAEGPVREIIWCGYLRDSRPSERELRLLEEFVRELGRELSSTQAIRALSKRVSVAETVAREKTDFIAQMSHDMRSPLYNVKSILNLLRLESKEVDTTELLDVARANCESLEELVEDVLDLTRHRAGKLSPSPELFDFARAVEQVAEIFAVAARSKGIGLIVAPCDRVCLIHADKRHVKRILTNVIGNAIKYTQTGAVSVRVDLECALRWRLVVRDSGCGMSRMEVEQLFTPFSRFRSASVEGLGLGLAISKILTELNGGEIAARSEVEKGSEFSISFPSVNPHSESALPLAPLSGFQEELPELSLEILVIDDDAGCVDSLARLLGSIGCRVLKAYSVRDAITLLNFEMPDCLISDAHMPDGGVGRLLRFVNERTLETSVVVISGNDSAEQVDELGALGAQCVFAKPLDFSKLHRLLYEIEQNKVTKKKICNVQLKSAHR